MESKKGINYLLQYFLTALAGVILLTLLGVLEILLMRYTIGEYGGLACTVLTLLICFCSALPLLLGIVFALVRYSMSEPKRAKLTTVASIVFPALQLLLCLLLLLLSFAMPFLASRTNPMVADLLRSTLRVIAVPLFLFSVVFALLAFLLSKKTILIVLPIELGVFLLSAVIFLVFAYVLHFGLVSVIGLGILQPAVVLLPNVGRWKARMKNE